jgi:hypothetical protein
MTKSIPPYHADANPSDTYQLVWRLARAVNGVLDFPYVDRTEGAVAACAGHCRKIGPTLGALLRPPHNQEQLLLTDPAPWVIRTALSLQEQFPPADQLRAFLAGLPDGTVFAVAESYSAGGVTNLFSATRRRVFRRLAPRPQVLAELETAWLLLYPSDPAMPAKIPAERRVRPMTLGKAAVLMGYTGGKKKAGKRLRALIDKGIIRCERHSRQNYVFDRNDFPKENWPKVLPPSLTRP